MPLSGTSTSWGLHIGHISSLPFVGQAVELGEPDNRGTSETPEDPVPLDIGDNDEPPSMFI